MLGKIFLCIALLFGTLLFADSASPSPVIQILCENLVLISSFAIFFVFYMCMSTMAKKSSTKIKIFSCALLMTAVSMVIRRYLVVYAVFVFGLLFDFVHIFGITPPLAMGAATPSFADELIIGVTLFCAFVATHLLLEVWIPLVIFPEISRKHILKWVAISVLLTSLMYLFLRYLCPSVIYYF